MFHFQKDDKLADLVPGARHVIAARSRHYIHLDQPELVTREILRVVRAAPAAEGRPRGLSRRSGLNGQGKKLESRIKPHD